MSALRCSALSQQSDALVPRVPDTICRSYAQVSRIFFPPPTHIISVIDLFLSRIMPSISSLWQPLLILVIRKGQCQRALFFHRYPTQSFYSLDVYESLSYVWWWCGRDFCVLLLDRQVRPHLCIHPDPTTVQPVLGVASVTPTPSTHGYNFHAHRHSILDRNTRVSARFVCLGVHAYYGVSSSNMWWLLD